MTQDRDKWVGGAFISSQNQNIGLIKEAVFSVRWQINCQVTYVYWTVHHFDSWIERDQLDVTCFIISLFNAQHVSDVNTSILRSLRLICWVISWVVLFWFDACLCYVVVWLGWCAFGCRLMPWNNSSNKSQTPEDGCINIRKMLSST